jgi:predicted nucleotidyltransferase
MKKSIRYLPQDKQEDLQLLVKMILERIPQTEMIILYGSYATGKYVEYDIRNEFRTLTTFMSDYDILVVTYGAKDKDVGHKLDNIEDIYYNESDKRPPVQFINDNIEKLNKDLSDGRYFYTQLKQEGIFLYNSGRFKLARRRKLRYGEIKKQAEEYFYEKYKRARLFYEQAVFMYEKDEFVMSSFNLHQTCENLFHTVRLVFTLENGRQHNLIKLLASVRKYSNEFATIFPRNTEEEKRLFKLLKAAYVEARYNPDFIATKQDIDFILPMIGQLFELVEKLCKTKIAEYETEATNSSRSEHYILFKRQKEAAAERDTSYKKTKKRKSTSRQPQHKP